MLKGSKKSLFRVLCLGALCLKGLMADPNAEELVNLGIEGYDKQDFTQAKKYFEKSCELQNGFGCVFLGASYEDGKGVEKDLKKALDLYEKACELKDSWGCFNAGVIYNTTKNFKEAIAHYSKACELNDDKGCYNLGVIQYKGEGMARNEKQAVENFKKLVS